MITEHRQYLDFIAQRRTPRMDKSIAQKKTPTKEMFFMKFILRKNTQSVARF